MNEVRSMMPEQIAAAAQWWADRLVSCKQSGLSEEERRDPGNRAYEFGELLMKLGKPTVIPEQIDLFRLALISNIERAHPYEQHCISVDYHPDRVLEDALMSAQIPVANAMPIKTTMWLRDDGTVAVRYGYGAPVETIYGAQPDADSALDPVVGT